MSKVKLDFRKSIEEAIAKKEAKRAEARKQSKIEASKAVQHELEYALTVLLVELASSDQNFDQEEYHTICLSLQRVFDTDRTKAREFINRATVSLAQVRGTTSYAKTLRDNLPLEQREAIIDVIEELIAADGQMDPFEVYHRNRIKHILLPEENDDDDEEEDFF
jgi:uncharacterized tellurite resistance protein B-like protein